MLPFEQELSSSTVSAHCRPRWPVPSR